MARAKKKTKATTRRTAPKKAAKKAPARKAATKKAPAKKAARARGADGRSAGKGEESDVEARWREYWECRTALESAVQAVVGAQAQLTEAREEERQRREVFDRTKNALRDLLEVEPASSQTAPPPPPSSPGLFDAPSSAPTLGVVDDDDDSVSDDTGSP